MSGCTGRFNHAGLADMEGRNHPWIWQHVWELSRLRLIDDGLGPRCVFGAGSAAWRASGGVPLTFRLTQVLTGHGCFDESFLRIILATRTRIQRSTRWSIVWCGLTNAGNRSGLFSSELLPSSSHSGPVRVEEQMGSSRLLLPHDMFAEGHGRKAERAKPPSLSPRWEEESAASQG